MRRAERVEILRKIEELRDSRVLTYICGDRGGAPAQISDDAIRPMYDHVRRMGHVKRLDLYLYSRGGAVEVPWRIVTMLREHCDELCALIPYRAHSAATLVALGCDMIVMGPKAELSPIDPAMTLLLRDGARAIQQEVRVEDVMSYVGFVRDKAGLGDQSAIASSIDALVQKLPPWQLGSIYRIHSHIRMVARRLLATHKKRIDDQRIGLIVETLAEKIYLHGHAIGRGETIELGLPVTKPKQDVEEAMWKLLESYEEFMEMRTPLDAEAILGDSRDELVTPVNLALVESADLTSACRGEIAWRRVRQAAGPINININLGLNIPPGLDPATLPQDLIRSLTEQLAAALQGQVAQIATEQVRRQSPIVDTEGRTRGVRWQDVTVEGI